MLVKQRQRSGERVGVSPGLDAGYQPHAKVVENHRIGRADAQQQAGLSCNEAVCIAEARGGR